jgi:hypothetical protein
MNTRKRENADGGRTPLPARFEATPKTPQDGGPGNELCVPLSCASLFQICAVRIPARQLVGP